MGLIQPQQSTLYSVSFFEKERTECANSNESVGEKRPSEGDFGF